MPSIPNSRYWLASLGLGLALLSQGGRASAAETAEPIRLELSSPSGCGSESELLRAVLARTTRARAAKSGETARSLQIAIREGEVPGKLVGELSISDPTAPDAASEKRTISSDSCRELLDALALFAALAVDPQASTEPLETKTEPPPAPPPVASPSPPPAPTPAPVRRSWSAAVGVDGGTLFADTASQMLLAEPYLALSWGLRHTTGFSLSPLVRLSFSSVGGDTRDTADGPAHLHWTTLRLGACPLELGIFRTLSARPCAELAAGAFSATGKTIAHPESHTLSWLSLGPTARLEWHPVELVEVTASLGCDFPIKRDHFYFEPDATFAYRTPAVLGRGLLGLGLHFL